MTFERIRIVLSSAILSSCLCGIFGVRETDQAFWPLIAIGMILTWAMLTSFDHLEDNCE